MTINQYRRQYLRWHRIYERRVYIIFRRAMITSLSSIPIYELTDENYEQIIKRSIDRKVFQNAFAKAYTTIGLQHGTRVVKDIEGQAKDIFTDSFQRTVIQFIYRYAGTRITSVTGTLADYILDEIAKGRSRGETISKIITDLIKKRSFYRDQLLRIARTETTAAAGYASDVASSTSGIVIEKVWVAARDSRTRIVPEDAFDHYNLNNTRVPDGEPFEVPMKNGGIELLRFPGDPSASAGNVINCRCSMIKVVKRDGNGNIVRRF